MNYTTFKILDRAHRAKRITYRLIPSSMLWRVYRNRSKLGREISDLHGTPAYDIDVYDFVTDDACVALMILDRRANRYYNGIKLHYLFNNRGVRINVNGQDYFAPNHRFAMKLIDQLQSQN